nr:MAG TPA: DNA pilot protein VP2 [Microviridae sp.]
MGKFFQGAGGALIGGALSGISNLFGAHSQNQSVEKQLAAAREEAEKTRKWQTSERESQNDWNYKLWQANNEYNTPAAVQSRLQAAGINPDLYVTQGALQGSSVQAQGGHTPSGPVADTSAWNRYRPIGSVASQALADTALSAQVAKTNAETEGQKHTNDILSSDASFRDAFNQGQLDTIESTILVNGSKINLNDAQASQARSMVEQINASIKKIKSEVDLLISQAADTDDRIWGRHVRVALDSFIEHGKLKALQGQLKVSEGQLKLALRELAGKLPLMKSQEKLNGALASFYQDLGFKASAETDRLRFDLVQDMNWDDFERTMNQIHAILGDIASFIPFANPRASNSGKPKTRTETSSRDKTWKQVEYDYYD